MSDKMALCICDVCVWERINLQFGRANLKGIGGIS